MVIFKHFSPLVILALLMMSCAEPDAARLRLGNGSLGAIQETESEIGRTAEEVESAVWAFRAANTSRSAEDVISLLWPEFTMLVDGSRVNYEEVAAGSRAFMASLEHFSTHWSDLQIIPLGPDEAVASFLFRDSIRTKAGELIEAQGPTSFIWQRRAEEWRLLFADADHYPVEK